MTFAGVPHSNTGRTEARTKAKVAIAGVPSSMGSTGRTGQDSAPDLIRAAVNWDLADMQDWRSGKALDFSGVVDVGNSPVAHGNLALTESAAIANLTHWRKNARRLVVLGGDNLVSKWAIQALGEPVQLVLIDAHTDTWPKTDGHSTHESWVRDLDEMGKLAQVTYCGLRAYGGSIDGMSCPVSTDGSIALRDDVPVWLALDIDGVDPVYAPGTGYPVPFGLSSHEVGYLIRYVIAHKTTRGMDITEVIPSLDDRRMSTCVLAHWFVLEAIAAMS